MSDLLIYDVGGCEGCPLSILRVLPQLEERVHVSSRALGNLSLSRDYDYAVVTGSACINEERVTSIIRRIREKAKVLIAYGSCASVGGITLFCRGGQRPRPEHRTFLPISSVVEVDYAIPGCPPNPTLLVNLLDSLEGKGGSRSKYFLSLFSRVAKEKKLSGFDLMDEIVLSGLCIGCGACVLSCPAHALHMVEGKPDLIPEKCIRCGTCCVRCPRFTQLLLRRPALSRGVV